MAISTRYTCDLCKKPIDEVRDVKLVTIQPLHPTRDGRGADMFEMHANCASAVSNDIRFGHIARNHKLLHDSDD